MSTLLFLATVALYFTGAVTGQAWLIGVAGLLTVIFVVCTAAGSEADLNDDH